MALLKQIINHTGVDGDIGIEIEIEGRNLPGAPRNWRSTDDSSLRGESREYVSEYPVKKDDVKAHLQNLQERVPPDQIFESIRAGVHVHINCLEMTTLQIVNNAVLYYVFEPTLVRWCGPNREGNHFCLRGIDADDILNYLYEAFQSENLLRLRTDTIRYAALNWSSLLRHGTLEYRSMQTDKDLMRINTWVEMLWAIHKASFNFQYPSEIIAKWSTDGADNLAQEVFGPLVKEFNVENWSTELLDGMRFAQDVAHIRDWTGYNGENLNIFERANF